MSKNTGGNEKPWWFPELTNDEWIARIRAAYPDATRKMDDKAKSVAQYLHHAG